MAKMEIYYSMMNCGDGSAYPKFFLTEELAKWHQENMEVESWGESCTSRVTVEGNDLSCPKALSAERFYLELIDELDQEDEDEREKIDKFCTQFFPNGPPRFTAKILDSKHYGIYFFKIGACPDLLYKMFQYPGETSEEDRVKCEQKVNREVKVNEG